MNEKKLNIKDFLHKSKLSIAILIFFLLLAFGERLISTSFSIDTEFYISNYVSNFSWWINLNRWGLVIINKLLSVGPLLIFQSNLLTICFIIVYSILFMYLFYLYIPKKWEYKYMKFQFIFPIIFITNPIFAEQYNFINQNVGVSLGIIICSISAIMFYCGDRAEGLIKTIIDISAILITTFAFGIYQSIVPLYILIIACTYFLECINKENSCWKFFVKRVIQFLIICLLYLAISKIIGGENNYLQSGWSTYGLNCIKNIYYVILDILKCHTVFYNISYLIAITLIISINLYWIFKKKNNFGIVLSSVGLLLAPFYIMIITGVDQLKRTQFNYSFVIGFILLIASIIILNHKKLKYIGMIVIILSLGIAYKQAIITGKLFYSDNVRFQNDVILANKIQTQIEQEKWYKEQTKYTLIILGEKPCNSINFYDKGEVIGHSFFEFDYQYVYGPSQRANIFMKTLGYDYKEPSYEDFEQAKDYAKKNNVKTFPEKNSIVKIDNNRIIIRLSKEI